MEYSTIKELVIDVCATEGTFPSFEKLTALVLENFPTSKWQKTHYAWYKSKIKRGEIEVPGFTSVEATDEDNDVQESIDASLSLEKDLHSYLARNISDIEDGLSVVEGGIEYALDAGRIDILAKDKTDQLVVIELKAGKAKDSALGQLLGYIGCLSESSNTSNIRGILVASDFDKRVVFGAKALSNVKLVKYQVSFNLEEVT
ncbi:MULTISPECIES: endonuclease NucS domain-containing protein [unclassified Vibrio]|uniref:endonuclease NucS domain-containing protein n=1 Tax=unclassified Vibrio TaxID=2614977 RepID=UPI00352DAD51